MPICANKIRVLVREVLSGSWNYLVQFHMLLDDQVDKWRRNCFGMDIFRLDVEWIDCSKSSLLRW